MSKGEVEKTKSREMRKNCFGIRANSSHQTRLILLMLLFLFLVMLKYILDPEINLVDIRCFNYANPQ